MQVRRMKRILRLLRYVRPYSLHVLISVLLMAVYAVMAGFRVMLDQARSWTTC